MEGCLYIRVAYRWGGVYPSYERPMKTVRV